MSIPCAWYVAVPKEKKILKKNEKTKQNNILVRIFIFFFPKIGI